MRIIAGKYKGLKLNEFEFDNIRPTIDRVRESIFNKIQFNIVGSTVLDLFGGTGAVSLEFLSRGAEKVITVDNNKNSIKLIKQNFGKAKAGLNLFEMSFEDALKKFKGIYKFDIIFLDPPFNTDLGLKALEYVLAYDLLSEDGIVVYEHFQDEKYDFPNGFSVVDERKYGTVVVSYLEKV